MQKTSINLTEVLTHIIHEISLFSSNFNHIDITRTSVCIASNKTGSRGGIYGKLVPLRFENGHDTLRYRGELYTIPEVIKDGIPQLYMIYFYMTKFFDLDAREKLRVIFHELFHVSPEFNGDIRRMGNVKVAHGHSRNHFDSHFEDDARRFYDYIADTPYFKFLEMSSKDLFGSFGSVTGRRMKVPKPVILQVN